MIDLTQIINDAFFHRSVWSKTMALDVAYHLKDIDSSIVIDFDDGVGENWISFVVNRTRVGYLHIMMPLFFHLKKYIFKDHTNLLKIVTVEDFESESFSLSTETFKEVFQEQPREIICLESFSIDTLWYMTIT